MKTRIIQTSEDNYISLTQNITVQREYGFSPSGNPIRGSWVMRKDGEWVDDNFYINDLVERNNLTFD